MFRKEQKMAKEKTERTAYSFRFVKDSQTVAWLNAQENRTVSLDLLIKMAANKYGNVDLPTLLAKWAMEHEGSDAESEKKK